jgi:RNA polymerase sigma-70 factor (ECF subfamily)
LRRVYDFQILPDLSRQFPIMRLPLLRPSPNPAPPAFRALFDEHLGFITRVLTRFKVPRQDLDDVTQEVLCTISRNLKRFDPSRGELRAWIYGIAARKARRYHRIASRRHRHFIGEPSSVPHMADPGRTPEESMVHHDGCRLLDRILERMDPKLSEVFAAYELLEMTVPEIAEALGIGVNTAKTRLHRSREEFQAAVARHQAEQKRRGAAVLPFTASALILAERARLSQITEEVRPRLEAKLDRTPVEEESSPPESHCNPGLKPIPDANPFSPLLQAHAGPLLGSGFAGALAGAAIIFAALWPLTQRPAWAETGIGMSLRIFPLAVTAQSTHFVAPAEPEPAPPVAPLPANPPNAPVDRTITRHGRTAGPGAMADKERLLTQAAAIAIENGEPHTARAILDQLDAELPDGPLSASRGALRQRLSSRVRTSHNVP